MAFLDPEKTLSEMKIAEGMSVADFDAGAGYYTFALARKVGPYGMIYAIDARADQLSKIRNQAGHLGMNNIEVMQGSVEAPGGSGLLKSTIDRVVIANVLFSTVNHQSIVREAKRVLKTKGKIGVVDWLDSFGSIGPHPDHIVSKDKVIEWFEAEGFVLESAYDAGECHYGLVFKLKNHE